MFFSSGDNYVATLTLGGAGAHATYYHKANDQVPNTSSVCGCIDPGLSPKAACLSVLKHNINTYNIHETCKKPLPVLRGLKCILVLKGSSAEKKNLPTPHATCLGLLRYPIL